MPARKPAAATGHTHGHVTRPEPIGSIHSPHVARGETELDAMGKDKRRQVVGHSYGPSRRQQLGFFAIVGMVVLIIYFGAKLMVAEFDQPPANSSDAAPWSKADAPQTPPARPF